MSSVWDTDLFKIQNIVISHKDDIPVSSLNRNTDLLPGVALSGSPTFREDGRPVTRDYIYNGVVYIRRKYYFIVDGNGLITRRTVDEHHILNDGSEGPAHRIRDDIYPFANNDVFDEQIQARKNILRIMKDTIRVALVLTHYPTKSLPEIVQMGAPFVAASEHLKNQFEEYGYTDYRDFISNCDVEDPDYDWMDTDIGGGNNLKDYMIGALTYTATTNHPDA